MLGTVLALYRAHPFLFLPIALAVVAPYELIVYAITGTAPLQQQTRNVTTWIVLLLVAFALVGPLVSALYIQALVALGEDERPPFGTVALRALRVLPVVAAAQIIAGITIGVGFVLFILPGVYAALRLAVVAQAAAYERTNWPGALKRSFALTRGSLLRILALLAWVFAVNLVLTQIGGGIAGNATTPGDIALGVVVATLTQSFAALASAVLYFDLRARAVR